MHSLTYLDSLILGIVEGLTEFLPVSSTGHLTIAEKLLGFKVDDAAVTAYTAIIQLGAIAATLLYFFRDIVHLLGAWFGGLLHAEQRSRHDYQLAWAVIAGSIPVGIVGFLGRHAVTGALRSLWVVAVALILWSAVMWAAERRHAVLGARAGRAGGADRVSVAARDGAEDGAEDGARDGVRQERAVAAGGALRGEGQVQLRDGIVIGLVQCFSLIPGISRSGATISAGLFRGLDRVTATRLSFFLAIPALTAAGLYELKDINLSVVGAGPLLLGVVVSFAVAYASIAWLLRFVAGNPITVFVWYRVALGVVLLVLLATKVLSAT